MIPVASMSKRSAASKQHWSIKEAPELGGFFVREIEKHMHVETLTNGEYFGDLQIGSYCELIGGKSIKNLKRYALGRIKNHLRAIIVEIEEGN
jgi:hypothetical protein